MYFVENVDVKVDPTEILQNLITLYFDREYNIINKILKLEKNNKYEENVPSDRYYKKGMTFCDDENPSIQVRIDVDEEIKYPLNTLLMISSDSIDEKDFISLIVDRWIELTKTYGLMDRNEIPKIVGKESYIQLKIGNRTWNNLSKSCRNKGILMKNGFKLSLQYYLNDICNHYTLTL